MIQGMGGSSLPGVVPNFHSQNHFQNNSAFSSTSPSTSTTPLLPNSSLPPTPASISSQLLNGNGILQNLNSKAPSTSLWQQCKTERDRLKRVPGFFDRFLKPIIENPQEYLTSPLGNNLALDHILGGSTPLSPTSLNPSSTSNPNDQALKSQYAQFIPNDPVAQVILCLRMGSSWSVLYNALGRGDLIVNPECTPNALKICQRSAAYFIMACKKEWNWGEDDLFSVSQLYDSNTNNMVKVVQTLTKLLDKLEAAGVLLRPDEGEEFLTDKGALQPKDARAHAVREFLMTERDYVADLERLLDYSRQVSQNNILTQDQIHNLFMNLPSLVDFQRKFLIGIEYQTSQVPQEQRLGFLFIQMEDAFSCYEPFCANFSEASELAMNEAGNLMKLAHVLDPVNATSGLPALLIKPVQRVCKYPLLLKEILKATDPSWQYYTELEIGYQTILRIMEKINETKREKENELAVEDLKKRVVDWKGHDVGTFGNLLLEDNFMVLRSGNEREYHVYLFERILLCCKEAVTGKEKKDKKSNSMLKKPTIRKKTALQLKGRIFVNNILNTEPVFRNGYHFLQVTWRGDISEEDFTIRCPTDEKLKQWQKTIKKAMEDNPRSRRGYLSNGSTGSGRGSTPHSQFPFTPASEYGPNDIPSSNFSVAGSSSIYGGSSTDVSSYYGREEAGFFDDDDVYGPDYESSAGRTTPSLRRGDGVTRSLPAKESEKEVTIRPRSRTTEGENREPYKTGYPPPPLPRGLSNMTSNSEMSTSSGYARSERSLKSSASSKNLRSQPSKEWSHYSGYPEEERGISGSGFDGIGGGRGLPRDPRMGIQHTLSRQTSQASLQNRERDGYYDHKPRPPPVPMSSQGNGSINGNSNGSIQTRNRSASSPSPNFYQIPGHPYAQFNNQDNTIPEVPPMSLKYKNHDPYSTSSMAKSIGRGRNRDSSDSEGRGNRSSGGSSGSGNLTYLTSPSTTNGLPFSPSSGYPSGGSYRTGYDSGMSTTSGGESHSSAIKIKIVFQEDTFVLVTLSNTSYRELAEKVFKKIYTYSGERFRNEGIAGLRLKYQDEEGDKVTMSSDEDVQMAFDLSRSNGNSLTIFC